MVMRPVFQGVLRTNRIKSPETRQKCPETIERQKEWPKNLILYRVESFVPPRVLCRIVWIMYRVTQGESQPVRIKERVVEHLQCVVRNPEANRDPITVDDVHENTCDCVDQTNSSVGHEVPYFTERVEQPIEETIVTVTTVVRLRSVKMALNERLHRRTQSLALRGVVGILVTICELRVTFPHLAAHGVVLT